MDPEVTCERNIMMQYARNLTLDPNTAHIRLSLSEGNRKAKWVEEDQPYPDHPDRFEWPQVLSVESLTGRCYWEAKWSGDWAAIAVSYKGIERKGGGSDSLFGFNDQSWTLQYFNNSFSVYPSETGEQLPPPQSNRVGVYLDWPAGTLSFYNISPDAHTLTHIHTFNTKFTEPLYAGFGVRHDSSVRVCKIY